MEAQRFRHDEIDQFFALSPDLLATAGRDGYFHKLSPSWTRCLGWTLDELRARPWVEFVHPDDVAATLALRAPSNTSAFVNFENRYRHKDGSYRWLAWSASRLIDGSSYAVARDITDRKQAEAALAAQSERLQQEAEVAAALARVGGELLSTLAAPVLLDRLCRLTTEVLHCDVSHTFLWQPEEQAYVTKAGFGDTAEQWETLRLGRFPLTLVGPLHEQLRREETLQLRRSGSRGRLLDALLTPFGTTAVLFVALRRGNMIVGAHSAGYRGGRESFSAQQERIIRGIAQLASFALENARLFEEVESANRFRSEFVATMSHELRTPLSIVLGYHDLLLEGAFADLLPEQAETLRRANRSARELLDLITATLDLSRIEGRQAPLVREAIPVAALIQELAGDTLLLSGNPDLKIEWDVSTEPIVLMTDRVQLRMMLKNLIGNAIKFTDRGSVRVAVRPCDGGVEFRVNDTGIGIPPDALAFIFEPFRQADSSPTRRAKGAGLGLYIVRRLLDALGGTIDVQSTVGKGSTFRVWLPLRGSEENS